MKFRILSLFLLIFFILQVSNSCAQKIIAGPIQGETTDSSVTFWVLVKNVTDLSVYWMFWLVEWKYHSIPV